MQNISRACLNLKANKSSSTPSKSEEVLMEHELKSLIKVTAWTAASLTYAHLASSTIKPGFPRLLSLLPTILLFASLPWYFSTLHLRIIAFFFLAWLGVFKLLLLSFDLGPLSPSLPLLPFIATASLPIKPRLIPTKKKVSGVQLLIIPSALKVFILSVLFYLYRFKNVVPYFLLLLGYNLHIYLSLDLVLSSSAFVASSLLRIDLDPQFHVPIASTSLQDFWGRRWNLMVTDILRPLVYDPIKLKFGTFAGIMAAFVVSGFMHEVLFYYLDFPGPRGEAMAFFVVQGMFMMVEMKARREKWWRPPSVVAVLVSVGFVMLTSSCLLFPPMIRGGFDVKVVEESMAVMRFFVGGARGVLGWIWGFLH